MWDLGAFYIRREWGLSWLFRHVNLVVLSLRDQLKLWGSFSPEQLKLWVL